MSLLRHTFLAGVAALTALAAVAGAAHAQDGAKGEVCVKHSGAYVASITWGYLRYDGASSQIHNSAVAVGQMVCNDFSDRHQRVSIIVQAWLGNTEACEFDVSSRTGRLIVEAGGTTLGLTLKCP